MILRRQVTLGFSAASTRAAMGAFGHGRKRARPAASFAPASLGSVAARRGQTKSGLGKWAWVAS